MKKLLILALTMSLMTFAISCGKGKEAPKGAKKEKTAEDKKAIQVFNAQGCKACHFKESGMETKPYPSLPHMASRTPEDFKKCIQDGVKGTTMVAYKDKVSEDDIKLIYNWITKFYKGQ